LFKNRETRRAHGWRSSCYKRWLKRKMRIVFEGADNNEVRAQQYTLDFP